MSRKSFFFFHHLHPERDWSSHCRTGCGCWWSWPGGCRKHELLELASRQQSLQADSRAWLGLNQLGRQGFWGSNPFQLATVSCQSQLCHVACQCCSATRGIPFVCHSCPSGSCCIDDGVDWHNQGFFTSASICSAESIDERIVQRLHQQSIQQQWSSSSHNDCLGSQPCVCFWWFVPHQQSAEGNSSSWVWQWQQCHRCILVGFEPHCKCLRSTKLNRLLVIVTIVICCIGASLLLLFWNCQQSGKWIKWVCMMLLSHSDLSKFHCHCLVVTVGNLWQHCPTIQPINKGNTCILHDLPLHGWKSWSEIVCWHPKLSKWWQQSVLCWACHWQCPKPVHPMWSQWGPDPSVQHVNHGQMNEGCQHDVELEWAWWDDGPKWGLPVEKGKHKMLDDSGKEWTPQSMPMMLLLFDAGVGRHHTRDATFLVQQFFKRSECPNTDPFKVCDMGRVMMVWAPSETWLQSGSSLSLWSDCKRLRRPQCHQTIKPSPFECDLICMACTWQAETNSQLSSTKEQQHCCCHSLLLVDQLAPWWHKTKGRMLLQSVLQQEKKQQSNWCWWRAWELPSWAAVLCCDHWTVSMSHNGTLHSLICNVNLAALISHNPPPTNGSTTEAQKRASAANKGSHVLLSSSATFVCQPSNILQTHNFNCTCSCKMLQVHKWEKRSAKSSWNKLPMMETAFSPSAEHCTVTRQASTGCTMKKLGPLASGFPSACWLFVWERHWAHASCCAMNCMRTRGPFLKHCQFDPILNGDTFGLTCLFSQHCQCGSNCFSDELVMPLPKTSWVVHMCVCACSSPLSCAPLGFLHTFCDDFNFCQWHPSALAHTLMCAEMPAQTLKSEN